MLQFIPQRVSMSKWDMNPGLLSPFLASHLLIYTGGPMNPINFIWTSMELSCQVNIPVGNPIKCVIVLKRGILLVHSFFIKCETPANIHKMKLFHIQKPTTTVPKNLNHIRWREKRLGLAYTNYVSEPRLRFTERSTLANHQEGIWSFATNKGE